MINKEKLDLLIIGTGMYVCGKGTESYGTVLPAIMQVFKQGYLNQIGIVSNNQASYYAFDDKVKQLEVKLDMSFEYNFYASKDDKEQAYVKAINEMETPGAVIIVTPDYLHYEMAMYAIQAGKHVLVVKPLTLTVKENISLANAAREMKVYGAVEFHKRWDWANQRIKYAYDHNEIGNPLYFHIEYSQKKSIPAKFFTNWIDCTNIFQYLGVHYADIIHFVTNDVPYRIMAIGQYGWLRDKGIETYDSIQVIIEWSKGFISTILTNWIDPELSSAMSNQAIKLIGTKGRIESNQKNRGLQKISDESGIEDINSYFCQQYDDYFSNTVGFRGYGIESIAQFIADVHAINQGIIEPKDLEGKRPTFTDAIVSTAIIEGANCSLIHDNNWVYFKENLTPYVK